ncbi:MAG TPA: hypothetical protein VFY32_03405 [Solirubrobacteraceae bacterium]|nr:hypothetical protein [Solirubrobacteraceae bacterium]
MRALGAEQRLDVAFAAREEEQLEHEQRARVAHVSDRRAFLQAELAHRLDGDRGVHP